jgi:hypothetical protein
MGRIRNAARLAAAGVLGLTAPSFAQMIDSTWIGPASGAFWHASPSNWSSGTIPSNTGSTSYHAHVGPAGAATVRQWLPEVTLDAITVSPGSTVEVAAMNILQSTRIDGTLNVYSFNYFLRVAPGVALNGSGFLNLYGPGSASFPPASVSCDGGPLVIGSGLTVSGDGRVGDAGQPTINNGHVIGSTDSFSPLLVTGSSITNNGTFEAGNGRYLAFGGAYTRAQLGHLVYTPGATHGAFVIRGTLLNEGQTFRVDQTTGPWHIAGKIRGGTVQTRDAVPLVIAYGTSRGHRPELDDVTLDGSIVMGQSVHLYLTDGVLRGAGDVFMAMPALEGPSQIRSANLNGSVTISGGIRIHGGGNDFLGGYRGSGPGDEFNDTFIGGTVHSDSQGVLSVYGRTIHNSGTFRIDGDCVLSTFGRFNFDDPPSVVFDPGGRLQVDVSGNEIGGQFVVNGALDLTTPDDRLDLTLAPGLSPFTYYRIATTTHGIFGTFDQVTPGFDVRYLNGNLYGAAVPEPFCLIPVVAAAALLRRHRRSPSTDRARAW